MNKTYAVADLHGQYDLWRKVLNHLDPSDTLYVLGDCGDRGPEGWKIIKEALTDPRVIYILGNHDKMLLDSWHSEWRDSDLWMWNGGYPTFEAILDDSGPDFYIRKLIHCGNYCRYINTNGQLIHLTHAGFTLDTSNHDYFWDRDHFTDPWPEGHDNEYIVHGHTWCGSSAFAFSDIKTNLSCTVGRYCSGHKICIDGRSFLTHQVAILDLDTLQETVFYGEEALGDEEAE